MTVERVQDAGVRRPHAPTPTAGSGGWIDLLRSNSAIVVAETLLMGLILFTSFSLLVRLTDAETLGLWFLLNAIIAYSRVVDFWSNGLTSFVAEALGRNERGKALEFVGTAVLTGVLGYSAIAGAAFAALYAGAGWIAGPQHAETIRAILPLMAIAFWLNAIAGTYQLGFLGFSRPIFKACQTVGGALVFLAAAPLLAPAHGLSGIVLAQMAQGAFMLLFGAAAFRLAITRGAPVLRWRAAEFRKLVVFGSKAIVLGSVQLAIEPIIRILANQFGGLIAVTAVELASRLIAVVRNLIVSLGQILVPAFARLNTAGAAATKQLFSEVRTLYVLTTIPAFGLLISASPLAELVLLGRSNTGLTTYLALLSVGWIANTLSAPAHFLLMSRRHLRPLILGHIVMSGGAVVLGALLGVAFGSAGALTGAALAIVAASVLVDVAADIDGPQLFHLAPVLSTEPWLIGGLLAAATVPATLAISTTLTFPQQLSLVAVAAAVVLVSSARPHQVRAMLKLALKLG